MKKPEYLKHPENGRVLPWTEILAKKAGMVPCDADGNPLNEDCVMPVAEPFKYPDAIHSVVHGRGLGDPEKRKQFDEKLDDDIKSAIDENARRKSLFYNGTMGVLPEWVPAREQRRFEGERNLLLDNYSHEQVLEFIDSWPRCLLDDSPFEQTPRELIEAVAFLVFIKKVMDAGESEGLRMLAGEDAVLGRSRRMSNQKFGEERGRQQSEDRKQEWQKWNDEAARLLVINPGLKKSKAELARKIKSNLRLKETDQTIRKKLNFPT